MTIKLKNCSFFSDTIDYLGHVITPPKLHVATSTKKAIKAKRYLTAVLKRRSLLGPFNITNTLTQALQNWLYF